LVLSGHTHGGQVGLVSLGLPYTMMRVFVKMPDHGLWARGTDRLYDLVKAYLHGEDLELSWRVHLHGLRVLVTPKADVRHDYEFGRNPGKFALIERNRLQFVLTAYSRRLLVPLPIPWMRGLFVMLDNFIPNFNISTYWLDYVAVNRTCPVDNMPRIFGLMPARFGYRLDYLARKPWYSDIMEKIQRNLRPSR